jgi:hypothetical protein
MKAVNVSITVEVVLPDGSGDYLKVAKTFGHDSSDGQLVTKGGQVPRCAEEAIEVCAQHVIAMLETEYTTEDGRHSR